MKLYKFLICLILFQTGISQTKDKTLLTVGDEVVNVSEFLKVYNKNLDLVKDENQKDLENYLELFINYKLKLAEARRLGLDKSPKYIKEFGNYKKQLIANYASENKVTDALVEEAYNRMKYDVKAVHILIKSDFEDSDTLKLYKQMLKYRDQLILEGFESTKKALHDGSSIFVEDLGYFSTFKMVYDFETAAYKTNVGEVSMPFKTQFGYHVVKVLDKRPSRGSVTVSHIMISDKQKDSTILPDERAELIFEKYKSGESFEALAKQFSDDKSSARNGGKLNTFKSGQLNSTEFEDAAFALKNIGDVSQPVKTQYGYHIIKLLEKKPIQNFEDVKATLEAQVKRDSRSKLIQSAMAAELVKRYKINEDSKAKDYFKSIITPEYFTGQLSFPQDFEGDKELLKINDEVSAYKDFASHLKNVQRRYYNKPVGVNMLIEDEYKIFKENALIQYREDHLEDEDEDFADILKEYRDGLLLFDLMEQEIWNKASQDTIGLKAFYEENKSNYKWGKRVDVLMLSSPSKDELSIIKSHLDSGKSQQDIDVLLNERQNKSVVVTKGVYEIEDTIFPDGFKFNLGVSDVIKHNESYHVIKIYTIKEAQEKLFEDVRGAVINDYQEYLEKKWIEELKQRFPVKVNQSVFNSLK